MEELLAFKKMQKQREIDDYRMIIAREEEEEEYREPSLSELEWFI